MTARAGRSKPGVLRASPGGQRTPGATSGKARQAGAHSIAFPAISCGVYGYPYAEAAHVALATLRESLAGTALAVVLCPFDARGAMHYRAAAAALHIALREDRMPS